MKRYWLFAGDYCYPEGGMRDLVGSFATVRKAELATRNIVDNVHLSYKYDWWHIMDRQTMKIIAYG